MSKEILQSKRVTWLLLLHALPTRQNTERVNFWRKLKKFGAVALQTSGYVLPDDPAQFERLQWLSKEIRDAGGEATLIRIAEIDGMSNDAMVAMFNEARATEYKELAAACREALIGKKKGDELTAEIGKFQRRFQEIRAVDYFNSPGAHDAQVMLQRAEKALARGPGLRSVLRVDRKDFVGKMWLTRPRPGIDRSGSAWLIRKFIDPNARFVFGMEAPKQPKALPFDMADAEFSHHGDDCTFETLVKRFGITDKAVVRMAEMVHDADLEDEKFQRWECIGINAVLTGWARTSMSDSELLEKGIECFEGLYQAVRK
ncbi:MAG TPA: chromate resistance protein ChrB domain-containing protein [Candidatus Limnocylindrales bacterium]|jgi:hypothetical protein|nr:chromate resistance protein ChrB domain-containing protein [Candidatus Limnocylindrales bacterium]